MSSSKKLLAGSTSRGMKKCRDLGARNRIGISQSDSQTVDEYKVAFIDKAESLGLIDEEMFLVKWFREGLRDDIKAEVCKSTAESMDYIIELACSVETRLATTIPAVSVDKFMVSCDDNDEDPEEDPDEDDGDDSLHGDYSIDSRDWVYDDLDHWGVGTPPE